MKSVNLSLLAAQSVGFFVIFALALFLPAGTMSWWAGWTFLVLFFAFYTSITLWLLKYNPGLVQERTRLASRDQKGWDKVFFPLMLLVSLAWLVLSALDAVRFRWSHVVPWLQVTGGVLLLFSFFLLFLTFKENSYLSPVVRIQQDRAHKVVSTGPYRHVRHPMYAAFVPFTVGTSLLLGSWYGVILGIVFVLLVARRAVAEEHMLVKELPGYAAYMSQVRYRMIPYVW